MSIQRYLILMTFATIVSWSSWAIVLFTIDLDVNRALALFLFFGSLFLALTGTFALAGFLIRSFLLRHEALFEQIGVSFRQAVLLAVLLVGLLILQGQRYLTWWNALLLLLFISLMEFFFRSEERSESHDS